MTNTITAITICKNRLADLQKSLPRLVDAGFDQVVLVDYHCPQESGAWARETHPSVDVVRHDVEDGFNAAKARNLGAGIARGNWLFFVDADVLVQPGLVKHLRDVLSSGFYFRPSSLPDQRRIAYGSFVVPREAFDRVEGFDETYTGWGCEDDDMYHKLDIHGLRLMEFPQDFLEELETPEEDRMKYSPIKNRIFQHALNHVYLCTKKHLFAIRRDPGEIPLNVRTALYASIRGRKADLFALAKDTSASRTITVNISPTVLRTFSPLIGMQSMVITYEFTIAPP